MNRNSIFSLLMAFCLLVAFSACDDKGKTGKPGTNANGSTSTTPDAGSFKLEPGQGTPIQFSHLKMDFKAVTAGEVVHADYPFKNMTNLPVTIADVKTSCACIRADWTKGNLQPGQEGKIMVTFDTKDQFGDHYKLISVILQGSNEPITLELNGRINKAM